MKLKAVRLFVLFGLVLAVMASFTLRLMRYQVTDGAGYRQTADLTTVESIPIVAPRGEILDRNGVVLASNTVGYSVIVEKAAFPADNGKKNAAILTLTQILAKNGETWNDTLPIGAAAPYAFNPGSDKDVAWLKSLLKVKDGEDFGADSAMTRLKARYGVADGYSPAQMRTIIGIRFEMERRGFTKTNPFTLADNVNLDVINQISENSVPGIAISQQYTRSYPSGTLAPQVIGNVGLMTSDEYKKLKGADGSYQLSDTIGKFGVEQTMEKYLRGTNGVEQVEINSQGSVTGRTTAKAPKPGNNVMLTIDAGIQNVLQTSLQNTINEIVAEAKGIPDNGAGCKTGAAVVLNCKTGEVLGMASCPGYDNSTFYQNYAAITQTPGDPLNNKAVLGLYRPGSTYKPLVALSGLMNGVITPNTVINCLGQMTIGTWTGKDDVYGRYGLVDAIKVSSNYYFYSVATWLNAAGSTKLEETAKLMGLGQPTGIELPSESKGIISGPTYAKAKGWTWGPADPAQTGIGQLYNQYTPLQLAQYVSTLVNGGTRYQVHVVKEINSYDNTATVLDNNTPKAVSSFKIPDSYLNAIKQGMYGVTTEGGTAGAAFADLSLETGGKTGTAQVGTKENPQGWNGLFLSFAPYNDPQIVVAVAINNAAWGSQTAPVARDVLSYIFLNQPDTAAVPLPAPAGQLIH